MKEKEMYLVNKIFNNETIRTVWDKEQEKYFVSVVDIIGVLADSSEPRKYWNWLKNRLKKEENFETSSITRQLKLKAKDGKYRVTDVVDIEGMFRIIESIPSKNAEPIKQWLARLGKERIDETFDPSISIQRGIDTYRRKGYDEEWILKRISTIESRKKLIDVWKNSGVNDDIEIAILTNDIYKEWSGMTSKEYKEFKGLRNESLRDNMDELEVLLTDIGEVSTRKLAEKRKPKGIEENRIIAKEGGIIAANTRKDIESRLGENIVNKNNLLKYEYVDNNKIE